MFRMPSYPELSPDQEVVCDLPSEGRYLIIGAPGTGKTVLALMRAQMLLDQANYERERASPPVFLVYNQVLRQMITQATNAFGIPSVAHTYHRFFFDWFPRTYGANVPTHPGREFDFRWEEMLKIVRAKQQVFAVAPIQHLIIDEGQDFPIAFYEFIDEIAENVTVFADDHQTITKAGYSSSVPEIERRIHFDAKLIVTTNFRNTREIAVMAKTFKAGTMYASDDIPTRTGPVPKLISYPSLAAQADAIALYERARPRAFIGVIAERHAVLQTIRDRLVGQTTHPVRFYGPPEQGGQRHINFSQSGIFLLTYMSVKGLEFDVVFLPGVDLWTNRMVDEPRHLMATYVQATRPRYELRVLHSALPPPIFAQVPEELLPRHESALFAGS